MAQFYASIQGNRGEATRMGTKSSGIKGHIRGWNVGIEVRAYDKNGEDFFNVYLTSGSGGYSSSHLIGTYSQKDLKEQ